MRYIFIKVNKNDYKIKIMTYFNIVINLSIFKVKTEKSMRIKNVYQTNTITHLHGI